MGEGSPVTFTAKSMTLLTATSARSSAIFLSQPTTGSGLTLLRWVLTLCPALLCACAPTTSQSVSTVPTSAPAKDQLRGRSGEVCQADGDQWEADAGVSGETPRVIDEGFVKGAWQGTRGKVVPWREALSGVELLPVVLNFSSVLGSPPAPRSLPLPRLSKVAVSVSPRPPLADDAPASESSRVCLPVSSMSASLRPFHAPLSAPDSNPPCPRSPPHPCPLSTPYLYLHARVPQAFTFPIASSPHVLSEALSTPVPESPCS